MIASRPGGNTVYDSFSGPASGAMTEGGRSSCIILEHKVLDHCRLQ